MLSATKLDETFPNQKFDISNYKALCRDRNGKGILFYINENILYKIIKDEYIRNEYIRNGIEMILLNIWWGHESGLALVFINHYP